MNGLLRLKHLDYTNEYILYVFFLLLTTCNRAQFLLKIPTLFFVGVDNLVPYFKRKRKEPKQF